MKKGILYALYIVLILAAFGLLGYQVLVLKEYNTSTLLKAGIVIAGLILSLLRRATGSKRSRVSLPELKASYAKHVGNAFDEDPKLEKKFYGAVLDYNRDRYSHAIAKLNKLRPQATRGAQRFAIDFFTALCYDELGQLNNAIRCYSAALQSKEDSTAASNLGLCYSRMGNTQAAIEAYKRAVRTDQRNPFPLNNLAQLYIRSGEYETACMYAQQAIALNSRMTQALSAMAIGQAMLGNQAEYEKYYRQAVANGYDGNKIKNFIQTLQSTH